VSRVLDTTVIVDVSRGHRGAREFLDGLDDAPWCSEISRVEFVQGLRHDELSRAEVLFRGFQWASVDERVARLAGELGRRYRRSHPGLGLADLVIAATAEYLGLPLATMNVRHFPMFRGLRAPY